MAPLFIESFYYFFKIKNQNSYLRIDNQQEATIAHKKQYKFVYLKTKEREIERRRSACTVPLIWALPLSGTPSYHINDPPRNCNLFRSPINLDSKMNRKKKKEKQTNHRRLPFFDVQPAKFNKNKMINTQISVYRYIVQRQQQRRSMRLESLVAVAHSSQPNTTHQRLENVRPKVRCVTMPWCDESKRRERQANRRVLAYRSPSTRTPIRVLC